MILTFAVLSILVWAGVKDFRFGIISNSLSLSVFVLGLANAALSGWLLASTASAAIVLIIMIIPYAKGWMGGGDTKLLAAVATLAPPEHLLLLSLAVSIAAGVQAALILLVWYGLGRRWEVGHTQEKPEMPLAPAIAIAVAAYVVMRPTMI